MTQTHEANREMREYWTGEGVRDWERQGDWWERVFAPYGEAMLEAAAPRPGERVLDVGCGFGTTTVAAAARVAPEGAVVGVDISPQMLATARRRAGEVGNLTWLAADAQVHPLPPESYDLVVSRFALMLFDDPAAGFANLHRALRPGGRMVFVCWREPTEVEWIAVSLAAAGPLVGRPPELGGPGDPGPFAFADGDRLRGLVSAGGFRDVTLAAVTRPQRVGADLAEAVGAVMALPETERMLAGAPAGTADAVAAALRRAFAPYAGPRGVLMDGTAWLVSARR